MEQNFKELLDSTLDLFTSNLELSDEDYKEIEECTSHFLFFFIEFVQYNILSEPVGNQTPLFYSLIDLLNVDNFLEYLYDYAQERNEDLITSTETDENGFVTGYTIDLDAVAENCFDPYFPFFNALFSVIRNMDIETIKSNILSVFYKNLFGINTDIFLKYINDGWSVTGNPSNQEDIQKTFISVFDKYYNSLFFTNIMTLYNSYQEKLSKSKNSENEKNDDADMQDAIDTRQQIVKMMRPYYSFISSFANKKAKIIKETTGKKIDEDGIKALANNTFLLITPFTEWVMTESLYQLDKEITFTDAYNKIRLFLNGDDSLEELTARIMIKRVPDLFERCWIVMSDEEGHQVVDYNNDFSGAITTEEGTLELSPSDTHRYIIINYGLPFISNLLSEECANLDLVEFGKDYDDLPVEDSFAINTFNMLTNITCTVVGALIGGIESQKQYDMISDKVADIIKSTNFITDYFKIGDEIKESRLKGSLKGQYLNEMKHCGYLPPMQLSVEDDFLRNYLSIKNKYSNVNEFGFDANAETIDDYSKTVVLIESHFKGSCSSGTGYIVSKDGYVFTCAHVAGELPSGPLEIQERDYKPIQEHYVRICMNITKNKQTGAKEYEYKIAKARFVWAYPKYDFAVLKIEGYDDLPHADIDLEPRFSVQTDTSILELGYPYGSWMSSDKEGHKDIMNTHISVNRGTVSTISQTEFTEYDTAEVDLKAHHGNSGSPIINVNTGKVVGWLTGSRFRDNIMGTDKDGRNIYHFDEFNHINLLRNMKPHIEKLIENINETGRPVKESEEA